MKLATARPLRQPRNRGPQADRDRQCGRGRTGRPDPHRTAQPADAVRAQGHAGGIQRRPQARDRARMAGDARERHFREVHAGRRGSVRVKEAANRSVLTLFAPGEVRLFQLVVPQLNLWSGQP